MTRKCPLKKLKDCTAITSDKQEKQAFGNQQAKAGYQISKMRV